MDRKWSDLDALIDWVWDRQLDACCRNADPTRITHDLANTPRPTSDEALLWLLKRRHPYVRLRRD